MWDNVSPFIAEKGIVDELLISHMTLRHEKKEIGMIIFHRITESIEEVMWQVKVKCDEITDEHKASSFCRRNVLKELIDFMRNADQMQ